MDLLGHFGLGFISTFCAQKLRQNSQRFLTMLSLHVYIFVPNCSSIYNMYVYICLYIYRKIDR